VFLAWLSIPLSRSGRRARSRRRARCGSDPARGRGEQFAQPPDMHITVRSRYRYRGPDAVEQLLAAEHPSRMLEKKFQQPVFGRAEIDRAA